VDTSSGYVMVTISSNQSREKLIRDGWVEGEASYIAAVRSHWAFPALMAALEDMKEAAAEGRLDKIKRTQRRLDRIQKFFLAGATPADT
jgi:hypothetical protein